MALKKLQNLLHEKEKRPPPSVVGMAWDHDIPLPEAHRLLDCESRRLL